MTHQRGMDNGSHHASHIYFYVFGSQSNEHNHTVHFRTPIKSILSKCSIQSEHVAVSVK